MEYCESKSEVDLTLRLGLPYYDKQISEETKKVGGNEHIVSSSMCSLTSSNKGILSMQNGEVQENVEFGGLSSTYEQNEVGNVVGSYTALLTAPYEKILENLSFYGQGFLPKSPSPEQHAVDEEKICMLCGVKSTPLWRKGPDGPQTLCNACGLRHSRKAKNGNQ